MLAVVRSLRGQCRTKLHLVVQVASYLQVWAALKLALWAGQLASRTLVVQLALRLPYLVGGRTLVVRSVVLLLAPFPLRHRRPRALQVVSWALVLRQFVASISVMLLLVVVVVTPRQVVVVLVLSRTLSVLLVLVRVGEGLLVKGRPAPISIKCLLLVLKSQLALLQSVVLKSRGFVSTVPIPGSS